MKAIRESEILGAGGDRRDVSAVVICYNQDACILSAIRSVQAQSVSDRIREIIVVDDASTDQSARIIQTAAEADPRIRPVLLKQNSGAASVPRNEGVKNASGKLIAFLDGDDAWTPDKLAQLLPCFDEMPDLGFVYTDYFVVDAASDGDGKLRKPTRYRYDQKTQLRDLFINGGPIIPSATIVRRDLFDQVGGFDPQIKFNAESDLWLRCASLAPFHHHDAITVRKREWEGSRGSLHFALQKLECKKMITDKILALAPELAPAARKREAQILYKTGLYHLQAGHNSVARGFFAKALSKAKYHPKALVAWVMTVVLRDPNPALGKLRSLRNRVLSGRTLAENAFRSRPGAKHAEGKHDV